VPQPIKRDRAGSKIARCGKQSLKEIMNRSDGGRLHEPKGALIINADDLGRDVDTTNRILECSRRGTVSSASAMVYMKDSERAADLAKQHRLDAGLHLNLTTPFSEEHIEARLSEHHQRVCKYLRGHRFAQVLFHPGLTSSFAYVVSSQIEEFERIYGEAPRRIDGHHHMHLCANVLLRKLLPAGTIARRNFSFQRGEKGALNRWYRSKIDGALAKRHKLTDYFYSLPPMDIPGRLEAIFGLATQHVVEVETHPINPAEHRFLMSESPFRRFGLETIESFRSLL
jgi:chitin disaccharide deacetylase